MEVEQGRNGERGKQGGKAASKTLKRGERCKEMSGKTTEMQKDKKRADE